MLSPQQSQLRTEPTIVPARYFPPNLSEDEKKAAVAATTRKLCANNFLVFQKVELGFEIGPQHRDWWKELRSGGDCMFLSPRDHGKSHSLGRAFPIWAAKYNPWVIDILILSVDKDTAVDSLEKLKELIINSSSLNYLIPTDRRRFYNSKTAIKLSNGVVIKARGWTSPLRGRHPQLIILDDVLNEKNSETRDKREGTKTRFKEVVYPMRDRGTKAMQEAGYVPQIVVIGTQQDADDMYADLGKNPEFKFKKHKAIIDDAKQHVLWPERYPYQELQKIKRTVGSLAFSKEYQNEPMSAEKAIFPPKLFEPLKDRSISYVERYHGENGVFLGMDPSVPGALEDWTVCLALELDDRSQNYTILNYERSQPDLFQEQLDTIDDYCRRYKVTIGFIEDNLFQRIYAEHYEKATILPLRGHTVTNEKKVRDLGVGILSFRVLFENGKFRFPYKTPVDQAKTDHLIMEFNGIKKKGPRIANDAFHDDGVMALWHAYVASKEDIFDADMGK